MLKKEGPSSDECVDVDYSLYSTDLGDGFRIIKVFGRVGTTARLTVGYLLSAWLPCI